MAPLQVATRRVADAPPPIIAVVLGTAAVLLGWRGGDLPASLYRIGLFHRSGLTLWDSQWYGGHWTLGYSVIFAPIAGILGVGVTTVASAGLASLAFDRLVIGHFGPTARLGSALFALGTIAQIAIGQLPFLMGEGFALAACWAATRRRYVLAGLFGAAATLASPLAGAFLGIVLVAWLIESWPHRRAPLILMAAAVGLPAVVMFVLFPGQGTMPFPARDFLPEIIACALLLPLVPQEEPLLRRATGCYMLFIVASFVVPSPMGGNIGRLGNCLAIPLVGCLLWPHRRRLLALVLVPLGLWQWLPAWGAMTTNGQDPSTHRAYYRGLNTFLAAHDSPVARVEVVPTKLHWESAYVAPVAPLARGWERQLDTANNPIFYDPQTAPLRADTYMTWLAENGVRFVALSDAPLDYAAEAEGALVAGGVPGLVPAWSDAHWRVFELPGAPGLVQGPARVTKLDGSHVNLAVAGPGDITLRVRYSSRWAIAAGQACLAPTPGGWISITSGRPGELRLQLRLLPAGAASCPTPQAEARATPDDALVS